jgi:serine/threonine protein kinase
MSESSDETVYRPVPGGSQPGASSLPERIGRYRVERVLGAGSFGVVYLANDEKLSRRVAIKVPRADRMGQAGASLTEARTVARLDHPSIVQVYDVGSEENHPWFIVSKYIEGIDLAARLKQSRPALVEAVGLVARVAEALDHAHGSGLFHRDIKPSNILLDKSGNPYVADFGLSLHEQDVGRRPDGIVGTPAYMSPEQARGEGYRVDGRSDIFSLGVVLYELLTGRLPFRGDTREELLDQITSVDFPARPPRQIDNRIPKELEAICLKALSKRVEERYTTAGDMAEELREFLGDWQGQERSTAREEGRGEGTASSLTTDRPSVREATRSEGASAGFSGSSATGSFRIAILYKRHAKPDEDLLGYLEQEFKARGHQVFVDRHMAIGVEWAKELESQLRASHAVVLLLSAAGAQSEMLASEVQIAHDEAQKSGGLPRLLPVRINFEGPLPGELAGHLDRLQYSLWNGPEDSARLVGELLRAVHSPPPLKSVAPPGGVVPLDSKYYVVRPTDQAFQAALSRQDSVILLRGARQMGKTSLLARGLQQIRATGTRVVMTDFQKLNAADLASIEAFYLTLIRWMADELDLNLVPEQVWNPQRSPSINFERFLRREVLEKSTVPLAWAMDEVDRLFHYPFASEVFGLLRSWHNERATQPHLPWSRLTLAIAYATEAHLFISNLEQSPFNIGTLVALEDFNPSQVAELNRYYGSPLRTDGDLQQFFRLVAGQPYLVSRGLYEMVQHGWDIPTFAAEAKSEDGVFADHLRRLLVLIAPNPQLSDVMRGVLRGQPLIDTETFYRLRSAGVLSGDSMRDARPRCQLYATYLEKHLL